MILIALDEGGRFERLRDSQCNLIGGIIFECENEQDIDQEKKNLQSLFKTVCNEQNARYPYDLHFNHDHGKAINAEEAVRVKAALAAELPDYFRRRGRWTPKKPTRTRYSLFCMVGDKTGLDELNATNLRDDLATVRYDHMVYRTIENLIFFNPRYAEEKSIVLNLPTRVIRSTDPEFIKELKQLGYSRRMNKDGTYDDSTYIVTDETSFRTGLESALLNSDRTNIKFDLTVQSINYNSEQFHQMFLYLADTLCSVYQDAIEDCKHIRAALPALYERGKQLTGSGRVQIMGYHPIDQDWRRIWRHYSEGNWFEALKDSGRISQKPGRPEEVYYDIWIKPFEELMVKERKPEALEAALVSLDNYMLDKGNRKQEIALYIIRLLRKNYELIQNEMVWKRLEYRIAKISMGIYNHQGDYEHAGEEYSRCMAAAKYVPVEEFMGLQLYYAVSLCDEKRFKEAEEISETLVSHHQLLNEIKKDIWPEHSLIHDSYGRALSQYAQCLAYQGKYEEAVQSFREALAQYEQGTDDWFVTGSYLLHALAGLKDREAFEDFATTFFGEKTPAKRLAAIRKKRCGSIGYALYILLKGLWVFDEHISKDRLEDMLKDILDMRSQDSREGHPWEMVMKYCALLWATQAGDGSREKAEEIMQIGRAAISAPKGILKEITEENEKEYRNTVYGEPFISDPQLNFIYR